MVNGVEMTGQAWWANRILVLSALAQDPSCASLHLVCKGMPDTMKKLVKGDFTTWTSFCMAVKAISDDEVDNAVNKERRITAIEQELKKLHALWQLSKVLQLHSGQALAHLISITQTLL